MSERRALRWNGNPYEPDDGGSGAEEEDGAAFLLRYWMGLDSRLRVRAGFFK